MKRILLPLFIISLTRSDAAIIIDTGILNNLDGVAVYGGQFATMQFTLTQSYLDVAIAVSLYSFTPNVPYHINAYLTNGVGPGTVPPALASSSFSAQTGPAPAALQQVLFTGLSLNAGTYFLTLSSTDFSGPQPGAIWLVSPLAGGTNPNVGQSGYCGLGLCVPEPGFPPASTFSFPVVDAYSNLVVTGTPLPEPESDPIPEPASSVAVMGGLVALLLRRHLGR